MSGALHDELVRYLDVHFSGVADVLAEFQLSLNEDL
jgi:hypothetical protein